MLYIIMVVVLQALITLTLLMSLIKNRESVLNMLLLYIGVVTLDMGYEYFIIQRFGYESVLYEIPGSLRVFKGLIFLYITTYLIHAKWRDKLKYLIVPLTLVVIHHAIAISAKMLDLSWADLAITSYKSYFVYYSYYWIACLVLCIYLLTKYHKNITHPVAGNFRYLVCYVLLGVLMFWTVYKLGWDTLIYQKVYSLLFLFQFGWILYVYILTYQHKLQEQQNTADFSAPKETYQYKDLSKIDFEAVQNAIISFYKESHEYLDEEFTLDQLSSHLKINKADLSITFNKHLHSNFHEYTNRNRIQHFKQILLEDPSVSVTDLAFQCGFKSKSTFYKYFKKEFDCLPSQLVH
ncbi:MULTISPECIES: helix-turn-helix domain-containing protein [unclassified Chryseobacterium]|uniref:helix-turn-helix domain-containing protein n=1 Tax=unclassified Chryseobacterium TaxID=2593645 RepID=UPI00285302C6|nr:helix-turn-helix domain-containing protein [Chryseobacterium sp. CFS7]MDR4895049.1 helix-turn-helix domain-containing protein [Chryseobacterium sp. CFS7]